MNNRYDTLVDRVQSARQSELAINILGASSKASYGSLPQGQPFSVEENQGIVEYDPAELVIVARAGTPLEFIQHELAKKRQTLGFEPPYINRGATLGGAIASGLAGAARPYRGSVRDYLLGVKLINGKAQISQFGGRVMKNVAGFDLFRPMAGAMGTLGILLEASLRVIPLSECEKTIELECDNSNDMFRNLRDLDQQLNSLSASSAYQGKITVRLSGSRMAVDRDYATLQKSYAPEEVDSQHWQLIDNMEHAFFNPTDTHSCVIALDLPPSTPPIKFPGEQLITWGGARRYLKTSLGIESVRQIIQTVNGHATLLSGGDRAQFFHPLSPELMAVHKRLKGVFDPKGILNPGRLYPGL